jgi:hypothetical protein
MIMDCSVLLFRRVAQLTLIAWGLLPVSLNHSLNCDSEYLLAYPSLDPVVPSLHPTHPTHSARGLLLGGLVGRERVDVLLVVGHLTGVHETTALAPLTSPSIRTWVAVRWELRTGLRVRDLADEVIISYMLVNEWVQW